MTSVLAPSRRLGHILGCAIVAATVFNGAGAFLRRVGVIEPARYDEYWKVHDQQPSGACYFGTRAYVSYVYETPGLEMALKLVKDVVLIGVISLGAVALLSGRNRISLRGSWALCALAGYVALMAARGLAAPSWLPTVAGLRSLMFVPVGLVAFTLLEDRATALGRWLTGLLVFEATLLPWELLRSIHLHGELPFLSLPRRLAATFVMPNALGIAAVVLLSFIIDSGVGRSARRIAWVVGTALVLAAGSGSGVVLLAVLIVGECARRSRRPTGVWIVGLVACVLAAPFLPRLLMRPALFQGLFGPESRLEALRDAMGRGVVPLLFGDGLGVGTNTAITAIQASTRVEPASLIDAHGADSAVLAILLQLGVVGLVFTCLAFVSAWRRLPRWRPMLTLICLAAVTSNVTELFPVNLLLGLVLGTASANAGVGESPRPA